MSGENCIHFRFSQNDIMNYEPVNILKRTTHYKTKRCYGLTLLEVHNGVERPETGVTIQKNSQL